MGKFNKKYLIKGLRKNAVLQDSVKIILDEKLKNVFILIDKFLEEDSEVNLHQLRITLRRFRYALETFYLCIDEKLFTAVLKKTKNVLDDLGEGRDQDVLSAKLIAGFSGNNTRYLKEIFKILDFKHEETRQRIKSELIKFICDKNVNMFFKKNKLEQ
jgi:CHAD domain-containing protein